MTRRTRWYYGFAVFAACAGLPSASRAEAVPAPVGAQRLAELVRYLGDEEFRMRERASKELFAIGLPARDALLEGAKDPDPEVRRRCRELLPEILEADRQAKLAAFVADTDGKRKHDLPGWERYRQVAGADAEARKLFVEIQKQDTGFLRDIDRDSDHAGELCASLCQTLFQKLYGGPFVGNRQINLAEVAPLLLVASDPKVRMPQQQRYMMSNFLYQPATRTALRASGSAPFKKIVLAWMYRQTDDEVALQQMFHLVANLDLKEGVDLALKVLREKKVKGHGLGAALTTVGKLGGKQHLALLEPFLADQTVLGNFNLNRQRGTTQVRDVALAMMVHLTNQSHREYGFVFSQTNPALKFYANFLGFDTDTQRSRALAKWKEWDAAQKK